MAKKIADKKSNKLNIYLIKSKYLNEDSITQIGEDSGISKIMIDDIGILYYKKSHSNLPNWIDDFFNNHKAIDTSHFFSSGTKAVLIIKVPHRGKDRFFAIPFGSGRFLLKDLCTEERFGLITSLNILESKSIRGIDKRTLSSNPKNSREQISKASEAVDFQIDFENDLINAITGRSQDSTFGNIVTGRDALTISAKIDITIIKEFLKRCLSVYEKKDYQKNFNWIDQIKEVKNQIDIDKLNAKLLKTLKKPDESIWLAVPEIIDWSYVAGFKYSTKKGDELYDELELEIFISEAEIDEEFEFEDLEKKFISCWKASEEEYAYKWSLFNCLNAEIEIGKRKFLLSNGKWYELNSTFVETVNKVFNSIKQIDLKLPEYDHVDEGAYNVAAAKSIKALCLDAQNLSYGGGHSKIEFCDILTKDKKLIHVKKYGGSAVLSHLFAQGFVSAELLLTDDLFRGDVINKLLTTGYKSLVPVKKPKASDYEIVYAIITKQKGNLSVPFFSKVMLKNNKKILEAYGYKISLCKIKNVKVDEPKDDEE